MIRLVMSAGTSALARLVVDGMRKKAQDIDLRIYGIGYASTESTYEASKS